MDKPLKSMRLLTDEHIETIIQEIYSDKGVYFYDWQLARKLNNAVMKYHSTD